MLPGQPGRPGSTSHHAHHVCAHASMLVLSIKLPLLPGIMHAYRSCAIIAAGHALCATQATKPPQQASKRHTGVMLILAILQREFWVHNMHHDKSKQRHSYEAAQSRRSQVRAAPCGASPMPRGGRLPGPCCGPSPRPFSAAPAAQVRRAHVRRTPHHRPAALPSPSHPHARRLVSVGGDGQRAAHVMMQGHPTFSRVVWSPSWPTRLLSRTAQKAESRLMPGMPGL